VFKLIKFTESTVSPHQLTVAFLAILNVDGLQGMEKTPDTIWTAPTFLQGYER